MEVWNYNFILSPKKGDLYLWISWIDQVVVVFIDNFDDLRERIKGIDYSIMSLMAQRIALAKQVGKLKQQAGLPVKNFQVEKQVYDRIRKYADEFALDPVMSTEIYERLIEQSVEVQLSNMTFEGSGRCLVVGGMGEMGNWLKTFLESTGYAVDIVDTAIDSVLPPSIDHDYVFIATPLHTLPKVIEDVCTRCVEGTVVFEVGSLKSDIEELVVRINEKGVELVSIHPMFGPGVRHLSGRNILICVHSGRDKEIIGKVEEIFGSTLANLVPVPLEEHDNLMLYSLDLSHFLNLLNGRVLLNSSYGIDKLLSSAGTTFLKQFATTVELHEENPTLYYHIQRINRQRGVLFGEIRDAVDSLISDIEAESLDGFIQEMRRARRFLKGEE